MEALPLWTKVSDLHRLQEPKLYFYSERAEFEATSMVGAHKGLHHGD